MRTSTPPFCVVPIVAGASLWTGATALLLEDVFRSGRLTVNGALMPVLTLGTVAAAVFSHRRLADWRPISAVLFVTLAILGSLATVYGTLGRQAESRDLKQADAMAENRTLSLKDEELTQAKALAKKECVTIGPRCQQWQVRVDTLTREMYSGPLRSIQEPTRSRGLPPYWDSMATTSGELSKPSTRWCCRCSWRYLAARWGRDPATVSRWLAEWAEDGTIARERQGKAKRALTVSNIVGSHFS
jgi:hypothetical protein